MMGETEKELFGDTAQYQTGTQRMTGTGQNEIQEIDAPASVSLNLNIAHGINE